MNVLAGTTSMKFFLLLNLLQIFVQYGHGQNICGSVSFSGDDGYLTSPGYPGNYYDYIDCSQLIYARANRLLEITFLAFQTEQPQDYVTITAGGAEYGRYSGYRGLYSSHPPLGTPVVTIYEQHVGILFHTDGNVVASGFQLRWRYINNACLSGGSDACHEYATCTSTNILDYTCQCNDDFVGDGFTCTVDVCLSPELNNCHEDATCAIDITEDGYYTCQCNDDFVGDGFTCIETYAYCFRAEVLGNITQIRGLTDAETEMSDALNITFQQYEGHIDNFFVYGFNVTVEPTNNDTLIITLCFDEISKTSDELGHILRDNNLVNLNRINVVINETINETINGTINGTINETINGTINETINGTINGTINETINGTINETINETNNETINETIWALNDFNECDSNYLGCDEEAICENTIGNAICTCPDNRHDFEETTGITGTNCVKSMEFNCDGSKANISLLIPYWEGKYINVSNVFVNGNCSGRTDGMWHKYRCNGTVTVNTTHLVAAFRVADVIPIGGFAINRFDTTVKCIQPALQNFTGSIQSEDTVVDPVIETAEAAGSSLQTEVFIGGYENSPEGGLRTGDMACIKLSDPNIPENIRTMIQSFHTSAPGATATFTLLRDYCPIEVPGLEIDTANGGICFTMHRPQASTTLEVKLVVNFCSIEDCPTPSCLSDRNHILRGQKQSQELQEISFTINIAPDDTCDRDCGTGACLLDNLNQQRCICSDHSILTEDGKCRARGNEAERSEGNTSASVVDIMVLVVALLSGAFVLCLLGFAAYFFTRHRKADHVNDKELKMQEIYTNTIDKD